MSLRCPIQISLLGDVGTIMVCTECATEPLGRARPYEKDSRQVTEEGLPMAAMKPRTGDGPLEVTKEGRGIVLRMPIEGGGRLVVEMTPDEASALGKAIQGCPGVS